MLQRRLCGHLLSYKMAGDAFDAAMFSIEWFANGSSLREEVTSFMKSSVSKLNVERIDGKTCKHFHVGLLAAPRASICYLGHHNHPPLESDQSFENSFAETKAKGTTHNTMVHEASSSGRVQASEGILAQGMAMLGKYLRPYLTELMKAGPVPKHIAFIMDGNRRFASRHHQITAAGHHFGYYKVAIILNKQPICVLDCTANFKISRGLHACI